MQASGGTLHRNVGLIGVVTLGAGTAIGVSIFSILQPTAQIAGTGLLLAIAIAMLPMLFFAVSYAYLGSVDPVSGASYEWPSRFIHPWVGFIIAWLRIISNVGAMTILAQVMVSYLGMVVSLPLKPAMAVAITLVFAINMVGISVAAKVQSFLMALLLVVLTIFVATGLPEIDIAKVAHPLSGGIWPVLAVVPLMISLFLGIESAVEIGEEVRNPGRTIPLGIALACALGAIVYGLVAFTALGLIGADALAGSKAPLLDAARVPLGGWAVPLVVGAAVASILKSMNAAAMVFSRSLFAMGRDGVLPRALSAIHPRFGTPHVAILLGYGCAMAGLMLPDSLVFLLLAVNIPTMLKYMACSISAMRVARGRPELHARSSLRFGKRTIQLVSSIGIVAAMLIIIFGIEADHRPYMLVGGWFAVGVVYWFAWGRRHVKIRAPLAQDAN
ncbi:amino acid/polyamine/organocation transporter, APC superfamily [Sphingobium sp. AP50]|uniref:APC family permease n=1 Tax=Sphingobium sp. AP50 TaxID=1884369 RepID=UPI0008CB00D4|nr:amino acid permease [Sphingobium sp. AP50]SEJ73874.1 amino acid/polyamine/organocation transporter, APC superfamily [Sphingobium sp. AP50]